MPAPRASHPSRFSWFLALAGLGLAIFAIVALTGPGRIDIVDGQTRYEVGRSIVEHGDSVVRDESIWWCCFPGAGGRQYTSYRFPQSLVAAGAILVADATGPISEERRQFIFVLGGAVACAVLSVFFAIWFRQQGCGGLASILWGAGGVLCTPMWFYGTSTYDEYLGTTVLIAALVMASMGRAWTGSAIAAGLLLGLAYNCKQPLGIFALLALALHDDPAAPRLQRLLHGFWIISGLLFGVVAEWGYDRIKFPLDKGTVHADYMALYGPNFANNQLAAFLALTVSPSAGIIWYFPALPLCLLGMAYRWKSERRVVLAAIVSAGAFFAFICCLSYFKGDPCWGPRYLTPLVAVLWLFARAGAARLPRILIGALLALSAIMQLLALSVDMHRLYVQQDLSSGFGRVDPRLYFNPDRSHLFNRPREILEIVRNTEPAIDFSPAPTPTFAFPLLDTPDLDAQLPEALERTRLLQRLERRGPLVVERYRVLNSFRPWWASMTFLPPDERPVNLGKFAAFLLGILSAGLFLLAMTARRIEAPR